jgi:integrase/recombinase XerD
MTGTAEPVQADLGVPIEAYLAASLARGHSRETIAYRRVYLRQFRDWLAARGVGVTGVSRSVLDEYMASVGTRHTSHGRRVPSRLSTRTVTSVAAVLRAFFAWTVAVCVLPANPAEGLRVKGVAPPERHILTVEQAEALLAAPGDTPAGPRDRAILETLYSTGLRRAELCKLECYDLDAVKGVVFVRQGKGYRDRAVPIGRRALDAIRVYIKEQRSALTGDRREPALFLSTTTGKRLGIKALNYLVQKYAEKAQLPIRVSPITLRHTCATHLIQGGADIRDVQAILGHLYLSTTQIYTRVTTEDLVASHTRHHPAEKRRGIVPGVATGVCWKPPRRLAGLSERRISARRTGAIGADARSHTHRRVGG